MSFSFTLLLSISLITSILAFIIWLLFKKSSKIVNTNIIICCFILAIARLLYPFEFSFTQSLPAKIILPTITQFLYKYNIIVQILYFIWIAGIIVGFMKLALTYRNLRNWVKILPDVDNSEIHTTLTNILKSYGVKKNPFVLKRTSTCIGPLLIGCFHPTIVLPDIKLSDKDIQYILQHETAHFYYKHTYFNFFQEILCILYWWNPLFRLMREQASKTLEITTDLIITQRFSSLQRIEYLECLFSIAKHKMHNKSKSAFLLNFNEYEESNLHKRFKIITESTNNGYYHKKRSVFIYMFLSILLTFASYTIVFEPYFVSEEVQQESISLTPKDAYIIKINETNYELYYNNEWYCNITNLNESFEDIPIYNSIEEMNGY